MIEELAHLNLDPRPRECPGCQRRFLPYIGARNCQDHCTVGCCRKMGCQNARPIQRLGSEAPCRTCGRKRHHFGRFAPCSANCTKMNYRSEHKSICIKHRPTTKERFHPGYCRLGCYNSWETGSRERALGTRRVWELKNLENRKARALERSRGA